jgi:hypothetical protein
MSVPLFRAIDSILQRKEGIRSVGVILRRKEYLASDVALVELLGGEPKHAVGERLRIAGVNGLAAISLFAVADAGDVVELVRHAGLAVPGLAVADDDDAELIEILPPCETSIGVVESEIISETAEKLWLVSNNPFPLSRTNVLGRYFPSGERSISMKK